MTQAHKNFADAELSDFDTSLNFVSNCWWKAQKPVTLPMLVSNVGRSMGLSIIYLPGSAFREYILIPRRYMLVTISKSCVGHVNNKQYCPHFRCL